MSWLSEILFGSRGKVMKESPYSEGQQNLMNQLLQQMMGQGANGGYSANPLARAGEEDLMGLISNDPKAFEAYEKPMKTQFEEETLPELGLMFQSEFGGTNSTGFRNAALKSGTRLSENLAAQRANLKSGARDQLFSRQQNIQQGALGNAQNQLMYKPSQNGLIQQLLVALAAGYAQSGGGGGGGQGAAAAGLPR